MATHLEQAFTEAFKLSPKEQDALADWVLAELRSEKKWDRLFANSQEVLSKLVSEALAEHRSGQTVANSSDFSCGRACKPEKSA